MTAILSVFFDFLPGGIQFPAVLLSIALVGYIVRAMIARFIYSIE